MQRLTTQLRPHSASIFKTACFTPRAVRYCNRSFSASTVRMSAALELWVKGDPNTSKLGDCPFCHRVLLSCEEKSIPYAKGYVDFAAKPAWLLEVNPAGTVPVAKDLATDEWVVDSGVIAEYLEKKFPEHPLGTASDVGSKVFPAFVAFFKAAPGESKEKEATLLAELQALDAALAESGTFLGGDAPNATDCSLGPKMHHMLLVLEGITGWQLPDELARIEQYVDAWKLRQSWKNASYPDDMVLAGWRKKLAN